MLAEARLIFVFRISGIVGVIGIIRIFLFLRGVDERVEMPLFGNPAAVGVHGVGRVVSLGQR